MSDLSKQIQDTKKRLKALEEKAAAEKKKVLVNLHKEVGFESRAELIAALQALPGGAAKKSARKAAKKATATKSGKRRAKRTKITDELRKKVVAAIKAGEKGAAVAKQFGISIPSLQNIKKAAGLVKARS